MKKRSIFILALVVVLCVVLSIGSMQARESRIPQTKIVQVEPNKPAWEELGVKQDEPSDSDASTEQEQTPTEDPVTNSDPEPVNDWNEVRAQAEKLAMQYDYDAALSLLADYPDQPEQAALVQSMTEQKAALVRWPDTTTVTHVFFHSLIVDPARAFDGEYTEDGYNLYMATVDEFQKILEEMYANDFVLVRIHDIAQEKTSDDGTTVYEQGDIYLPAGKKPFVLSQDDTNYYEYMVDGNEDGKPDANGDGFASKLVPTADGSIACEYVTANGETVVGDYDLAPLLERFVEAHPDFSYRGARAIIGVTGYEGVYGYRTNPKYIDKIGQQAFDQEVADAKKVTERLKELGYEIASHSFGHPAYGDISSDYVASDIQKWEDQCQPITGETDIFLYPYGSDIAGIENYSGAKFEAMYAAGYRYFCTVDSHEYWVQIHNTYVRQGRRNIDGYRMYHWPEMLDDLFDVNKVFDPARPLPVPSM